MILANIIPVKPKLPAFPLCVHPRVNDMKNEKNRTDPRAGVSVLSYVRNVSTIHITFDIPCRITLACFS